MRRLDAHGAYRVVQERRGELDPLSEWHPFEALGGGPAYQRIAVAQPCLYRSCRCRAQARAQQLQRRGARDAGLRGVGRELAEQRRCVGAPGSPGVQRPCISLVAGWVVPVPRADAVARPLGAALGVTLRAGVGRADLDRQIRARHTQAVVVARMDDHVGLRRHVATGTRRSRRADTMEMMRRAVVLRRQVALAADGVSGGAQFQAVRLVAVRARHPPLIHPAL